MYQNYIFDLYGTLIDMWTDEYMPTLWKQMAAFYSLKGAAYTAKELKDLGYLKTYQYPAVSRRASRLL